MAGPSGSRSSGNDNHRVRGGSGEMTTKPGPGPAGPPGGVARTVATAAARPTGPFQVELSGGDGNVTALHDGGGPVLSNARVVLIYWGSAWGLTTTNPSHDDCTAAFT